MHFNDPNPAHRRSGVRKALGSPIAAGCMHFGAWAGSPATPAKSVSADKPGAQRGARRPVPVLFVRQRTSAAGPDRRQGGA
jgi:hypothetical protein